MFRCRLGCGFTTRVTEMFNRGLQLPALFRNHIFGIKEDTQDRTPQVGLYGSCLIGAIGRNLSHKSTIFVQENSETLDLIMKKFFTPFLGT